MKAKEKLIKLLFSTILVVGVVVVCWLIMLGFNILYAVLERATSTNAVDISKWIMSAFIIVGAIAYVYFNSTYKGK